MKQIATLLLVLLLLTVNKDAMTAPTYTIPVVVHVLYNTAHAPLSNISDAQVISQIDVLNQDFQLLNPDAANVPAAFAALKADCQIQFTLAKRDPLGNATTGIIHKSTTKTLFSQSLNDAKFSAQGGDDAWPSDQYLNIWIVASMVLDQKQDKGYAQAPSGAAATDGVAMYFSSFGTVGSVNLNSKGHIATHLVGHWLNLSHPWGPGPDNSTCMATDDVDDTPPQSGPSGISYPFTAPAFPHISCGNGPNGDLFMNFMDWTAEASRCMFTEGQKARMQEVLAPGGARTSLASSQGSTPPCILPISAPTGLIVTGITSTSATLNWVNTSANNYTLQWKPILSSTWITVPNISGATYTLSALTPGTGYSFKVLSNCDGTASVYSSELAFATICPAPMGLTVTGITGTGVTLNWTGVPNAANYTLQWKPIASSTWTTVPNIVSTAHTLPALTPGTAYSFKVLSNCSGTPSAYSELAFSTTCPVPTGLNATSITEKGATLSWNNVPSASSYTLQWKYANMSWWYTVRSIVGTAYVLNGAPIPGSTHSFKVSSNCSGTASAYSSEATFTNSFGPCSTPTGLYASDITSNTVTLNWANVPAATSYWMTVSYAGSNLPNGYGPAPCCAAILVNRIHPGTTYTAKVYAQCGDGTTPSAPSNAVSFTPPGVLCSAPILNVSNISTSSATFSWNSVSNANSYTLQWTSTPGSWNTVANIPGTTYVLNGLQPGTVYYYQIKSDCTDPNSAYSYPITNFTTNFLCSAPTLSASSITNNSATLNWTNAPSASASSYTLQWKLTTGSTWNTVANIAGNTYRLVDLTPGTNYSFRVSSNCSTGSSAYSNALGFTTTGSGGSVLCSTPTPTTNNITDNSATLNWSSAASASSYTLQWKPATATTWNTVANIPGTTYLLPGLNPTTNYLFSVLSNCSGGPSAYSNPLGFTTTGCPDNFEPNESVAAARQIPVNTPVNATIGSTTDKDYYRFTTSGNAPKIKVWLTNLLADYDLKLYSNSGALLSSSSNTGTTAESVVYNTTYPGTYYVQVSGSGTYSCNSYNLMVQTSGIFGFKGSNVPNTNLSDKFTLYPNPTRGEVSFEYNSKAATIATISIIDQGGRTCKTIQVKLAAGQNKPVFNISDLSKGFYYVRMVANEETLITKLFLER